MSTDRLMPHGVFDEHEFIPVGYSVQELADSLESEFGLPPKERPQRGNTHVSRIVTADGVAESRIHLCAHPGCERESYSVTVSSEGITLGKLSIAESMWKPVNGEAEETAHKIMGRLGYLSSRESGHSI